jgi:hypothetical protein
MARLVWIEGPNGQYAVDKLGRFRMVKRLESGPEHWDFMDEGYEPGDALANADDRGAYNLGEGCRHVRAKPHSQ